MKLTTKDIAVTGMMIAALETAKLALSYVPNVELVTLLIILFSLFFGNKIFYAIAAFVLIEGCIYGFGIWWVIYVYIWPLLAVFVRIFRNQKSVWFWSIVSAGFGLCFGALSSITYLFIGGAKMAFAWWVSGIPFDVIHCISNFVLCLVLFIPLRRAMERIAKI